MNDSAARRAKVPARWFSCKDANSMNDTRQISLRCFQWVACGIACAATVLVSGTVPAAAQEADSVKSLSIEPGTLQASGRRRDVEFGTLRVPENRDNPGSRTIELRFVRLKSTSPNPGSPIVYLAGGPGGSGIATARGSRAPLFLAFRQVADVIAFDQRGTGQAADSMRCENKEKLPLDRPGSPELYRSRVEEFASSCVELTRKRGIDLAGYGTHLALATARRYPGSVDRMILAGIEGPDHTLKLPSNIDANFRKLAERTAADSTLAVQPDLVGTLQVVLDRLEQEPVRVEVLPKRRVVVGKWDLQKRWEARREWNVFRQRSTRWLGATIQTLRDGPMGSAALLRSLP
jgi:pimeloyl-ACP methyl ester carboxylesterase